MAQGLSVECRLQEVSLDEVYTYMTVFDLSE